MRSRLAAAIVRVSAVLAPVGWRARWREEWLAEIARVLDDGRSPMRVAFRALGAPVDAVVLRWQHWRDARPLFGWRADLRDAIRSLRRTPWQTATVFGCLTVGTTLTVLVFAIVNAMTVGEPSSPPELGTTAYHFRTPSPSIFGKLRRSRVATS